jgi:hypothetical protein
MLAICGDFFFASTPAILLHIVYNFLRELNSSPCVKELKRLNQDARIRRCSGHYPTHR